MPEAAVKEKTEEATPSTVEPTAQPAKKSGGLLKLAIVIGVIQVVMAAGAFVVVKMVVVPKMAAANQKAAKHPEPSAGERMGPGEIYLIDNIIVNPAGTNGTRYLSTSIGLEVEKSEKSVEHIKEMTPVIRDILIAILSSKTLEELSSGEGKETIRKDILERVNKAIVPGMVSKVYFVDYVLQ